MTSDTTNPSPCRHRALRVPANDTRDARLLAEIGAARALEVRYEAEVVGDETPEQQAMIDQAEQHWRTAARLPCQTMAGALAKLREAIRGERLENMTATVNGSEAPLARHFVADVLDFLERPRAEGVKP